jgi:hypothetical protein
LKSLICVIHFLSVVDGYGKLSTKHQVSAPDARAETWNWQVRSTTREFLLIQRDFFWS